MPWLNTQTGYGALTKCLHWLVVLLFAFQYVAASLMLRLAPGERTLGLGQDDYFNWHKSIGLVVFAVAAGRLWSRRAGRLPDWAPQLVTAERRFIHRAEQVLYTAMFLMPVSGFFYTMAGGYGVRLFGAVDLPNPIGTWPALATVARYTHMAGGILLALTIACHVVVVLRHQIWLRNGLMFRMLPGRRD